MMQFSCCSLSSYDDLGMKSYLENHRIERPIVFSAGAIGPLLLMN